jgi:hypothetical protein
MAPAFPAVLCSWLSHGYGSCLQEEQPFPPAGLQAASEYIEGWSLWGQGQLGQELDGSCGTQKHHHDKFLWGDCPKQRKETCFLRRAQGLPWNHSLNPVQAHCQQQEKRAYFKESPAASCGVDGIHQHPRPKNLHEGLYIVFISVIPATQEV